MVRQSDKEMEEDRKSGDDVTVCGDADATLWVVRPLCGGGSDRG